jgi:hypothetical protein
MSLPKYRLRHLPLALCLVFAGALACGGAQAQQPDKDSKWDLRPLVPPIVPLPPTTQVDPAQIGGPQTPYTTAPLQDPRTQSQPAPGIKLSIPTK